VKNLKEIRWKQRFQNFDKAFCLFEKYADRLEYTELERAGLMQLFETAFELAWKVLKDYLEVEGYTVASPREAIKKAFQIGVIKDGDTWLEALEDRNLTSHTYDEEDAIKAVVRIKENYVSILDSLQNFLLEKLSESGGME